MYLEKSLSLMMNDKSKNNISSNNYSTILSKLKSQRILFCDYMKLWLETHKFKLQGNTYETYYGQIYNHIAPYFAEEGIYLDEINVFLSAKLDR
ncbi:Phage integrase, N-terminal SAM-like domain [Acetanaerobacterium elongatum]|uniref:Phage integrase, N-terminal SAM-like domain n=1 Tax=Acetanaerobacterium elongatum TaxID=258515 RepID=A0A1H0C919_9FIRM|nr:Phage integrase, N-terminal SAM-like domain [Acetanaerobacterium elongatum]